MLTFSRDRIASLKAAAIGSIALCISRLLLEWIWPQGGVDWAQLDLWLGTALCGGVFGLTYRYTLRQELDIHLTTGTIAAFAITRAAGQWESLRAEGELDGVWSRVFDGLVAGEWGVIVPIGVLIGRLMIVNGVPFGVAAVVLDGVFAQGWVDRCAGDRRSDSSVEG
jgi:hypothetical protein